MPSSTEAAIKLKEHWMEGRERDWVLRLSVETECPLYAVEVKMRWISVKNWEVGVGGGGEGREDGRN